MENQLFDYNDSIKKKTITQLYLSKDVSVYCTTIYGAFYVNTFFPTHHRISGFLAG